MDLDDFLCNSAILLKKEEMGAIIGPDPEAFSKLVDLSYSKEMPICWRAMWLVDYLAELHPWLATKYIPRAWKEIQNNHPDGVTRSLLRMLSRYEIPEEKQGIAADLCLEWLQKESVPVAIKAHSMEVLFRISEIYPELSNEFIIIMEEQAPNNSVGFSARARLIINKMRKL
jgi:hypothetical protein